MKRHLCSELRNMSHIKGDSRTQTTVFPFTLEELIAENNPVRVVDLFVDGLDLNKLQFISKGKATEGRPAFDNKVLLKLYVLWIFKPHSHITSAGA